MHLWVWNDWLRAAHFANIKVHGTDHSRIDLGTDSFHDGDQFADDGFVDEFNLAAAVNHFATLGGVAVGDDCAEDGISLKGRGAVDDLAINFGRLKSSGLQGVKKCGGVRSGQLNFALLLH